MGKKGAPAPAADQPKEEEANAKVDEDPGEQLDGEFIFPDGSTYAGQYLKKGEELILHGEGLLKTGPESFQGVFEKGLYKSGKYTSCSGAIYKGTFRNNLFHGVGEYSWPDGRIFRGTWRDGQMHGRGTYLNFSIGADKSFAGFSVRGRFESGASEQGEIKRLFLEEYGSECKESASVALRDLADRASPTEGPPREYLVPAGREGMSEEELAQVSAERNGVLEFVQAPFPEAGMTPPALPNSAALQAFSARLQAGAERPLQVDVYEVGGADAPAAAHGFEGRRLRKTQLQYVGQALEFLSPDAGAPGDVSSLVLINVSPEPDIARAAWKLVHCEVVAPAAP